MCTHPAPQFNQRSTSGIMILQPHMNLLAGIGYDTIYSLRAALIPPFTPQITLGELLTTKEVQLYNAQRLGFETKPVGKLEVLSCEPKTLSASGGGASNM